MEVRIATSMEAVPAAAWNRLCGTENPFLRHEFLAALERHRCISPQTGWQPFHLLLYEDECLLAAAPAYIKGHSWGEFVFDFSWAAAYEQHGLSYYPKLIVGVPYSPVTGKRALWAPEADPRRCLSTLAKAARALLGEHGLSSVHWLFPEAEQADGLRAEGYAIRTGTQFHWTNHAYTDFHAFLGTMSAKKRKNIRQERRKVQEAGVEFRLLHGHEVDAATWAVFDRFYRSTFHLYGNVPILNRPFFEDIGRSLGDHVLLALAYRAGKAIAGAFLMHGGGSLYGRYWGAEQELPGLHFETCYYQPIDYAIRVGMQRFEPGAQGEHKIARGFLPTPTYSAHWMKEPAMHDAVLDFTRREQAYVDHYASELSTHSPFRKE